MSTVFSKIKNVFISVKSSSTETLTNLLYNNLPVTKKKINNGKLARATQTASYNNDHFVISNMLVIPCTDQPLAI